MTYLPLPSFSVLTAGRQNWNHSASSCDWWTSVWLRQRARLAVVQDLVSGRALLRYFNVSRYFNFCHGSHRSDLRGRRLMNLVCEGHGCTKCSVTLTLTEQSPNSECCLSPSVHWHTHFNIAVLSIFFFYSNFVSGDFALTGLFNSSPELIWSTWSRGRGPHSATRAGLVLLAVVQPLSKSAWRAVKAWLLFFL